MVKVTIGNSMSKVEGLSVTQFKQLRTILSINLDTGYAYGGFSNRQYLMDVKGNFPTGLLYLVQEYLGLLVEYKDTRQVPKALGTVLKARGLPTPYPEQIEAATACLNEHRGILVAPTGFGKSVIIALMIEALQVRTLIVVPTLELRRQLTHTLREVFGKGAVGRLGHLIAVENIDALDTKEPCQYDCVIIDEFHHSGAKTYRKLNQKCWTGVYYRFGLTATPFRSQDHEKLLLESVLSQVIYEVDYQNAVKQGYIAPLEAYYIEVPKAGNFDNDYHVYSSAYTELIVNHTGRNILISVALARLHQAGVSTLCLVKQIEHGLKIEANTGIAFVKGENDDNPEVIAFFNEGKTALIGTHGVLGEGVDTKACEYVIVATPMKSKNLFMQCVGRSFRRYPGKESAKVIIIKDSSHKWFRSAFREQVKILREEYGIVPIKLDLL